MEYPILLIPLLPLLGAVFNLFIGRVLWRIAFGRDPSRQVTHFVAVATVVSSCAISAWLVFGPLLEAFRQWDGEPGTLRDLHQLVYTWIEIGSFKVDLAFRIDTLSAVMILVITFVGSLIHIYSTGYMADEKRHHAYFGYLNLFTGAMLILVLADNLPVMFIGWEGVGLCSYLLIGFWFEKTENANAGRKAFVVNRIGDFAFLLGMFLLFQATETLNFEGLQTTESMAAFRAEGWLGERTAMWAGLLLFIGACGKSAQIPLYVWLPDAMAGPTPVSALIHAATMVTAGVYMVARLSFLYASSTTAMAIVAGVGALTALVAAIMAFAQTDFKKVLAYSTVSQLGFMFVGVGVGAYVAGIFHLVTHAFFKAGLFLAAGSVMHAMSGSGDIMKMGGLRKYMKFTHIAFVAYWLAICGIFPFAGFFSKDEILAGAWVADGQGWLPIYGEILWAVLSIAALGTAFYMSRLYFLVFWGKNRADEEVKAHIHESPASMTGPLLVLAVFTLFLGFIGSPHFSFLHDVPVVHWFSDWLQASIARPEYSGDYQSISESIGQSGHLGDGGLALFIAIAMGLGVVGIFLAYRLYSNGVSEWVESRTATGFGAKLHDWVYNKFYVDEVYEKIIVQPFRWACQALFAVVDRFVIDIMLVNGSAVIVGVFGRFARWLQNGQVHRYLTFVLVGAAAVFLFTRGTPVDFDHTDDGQNITFVADVGAGPGAVLNGATIQWDINGDGKVDDEYTGKTTIVVDRDDVGSKVTLWYTDPVFGDKVSRTRSDMKSTGDKGGAQ